MRAPLLACLFTSRLLACLVLPVRWSRIPGLVENTKSQSPNFGGWLFFWF
ncbi:hypothetical protein RBSH_02350 [Rhodopirellula baltica SH28]|uniref:Uncharacterized protein n=1 Tax=Rhodopirellula baltica SH28 TaxID=993517 RepID=K5DHL4_RHOBT|nr:hypothetical protein RBSH_02350 [Rhodopirellula baltica SH28]